MAVETAIKFFNKELVKFVSIDGTEYAKHFFDMVIFYAGAYSCSGTIDCKDSFRTKVMDSFMISDDKIYVLTYLAEDKYFNEFISLIEEIKSSMKFVSD